MVRQQQHYLTSSILTPCCSVNIANPKLTIADMGSPRPQRPHLQHGRQVASPKGKRWLSDTGVQAR